MKSVVTSSLAALLVLSAAGCGRGNRNAENQAPVPGTQPTADRHSSGEPARGPASANRSRRLESITWNSVKHELTWVVSQGERGEDSGYRAFSSERYVIRMDEATMTFSGETRRFSEDEAENVRALMDMIAKYAVDSTVWWDDGLGQPVDGSEPKQKTPGKLKSRDPNDPVPMLHVAWKPAA
jgi:hypothetical protein